MSQYPTYDVEKKAWITSDKREFAIYSEAQNHENNIGELTLNNLIKVLKSIASKDGDKKVFFDIAIDADHPIRFRRRDISHKTIVEAFTKWYDKPDNRIKLSECTSEFDMCKLIFEAGASAFDVWYNILKFILVDWDLMHHLNSLNYFVKKVVQ